MTKMICQISKQRILEDPEMEDPIDFVVSDDKFELLELVVDKMKSIEVGESFIVNLVTLMDEEEEEYFSHVSVVDRNEVIYDIGLRTSLDLLKTEEEETL